MPGDWFKNRERENKQNKNLTYGYLRVSAPKYLDFEERAGEREKGTFCVAQRQNEKKWRLSSMNKKLVQTGTREKLKGIAG